jgi:hypothetical protein
VQFVTVEPGCYFIDATLVPAMENPDTSCFFNKQVIARFQKFGGVRIESDVVCTLSHMFDLHSFACVSSFHVVKVSKLCSIIQNNFGIENIECICMSMCMCLYP